MKEIVGARIGGTITNRPDYIIAALKSNQKIQWLDRKRMQFMASCDVGQNWTTMATGRTLFRLDKDNNAHKTLEEP